jgi:hypothetical protein
MGLVRCYLYLDGFERRQIYKHNTSVQNWYHYERTRYILLALLAPLLIYVHNACPLRTPPAAAAPSLNRFSIYNSRN